MLIYRNFWLFKLITIVKGLNMDNKFAADEINFFHNHIELLKPAMIGSHLPACIHLENFFRNPKERLDDTLPYISFGGSIYYDRTVEYIINTGDYYICAYVASGKLEFGNDDQSIKCSEKNVLIAYKNSSYILKSISRELTLYLYFINGAAVDSYCREIISQSGHKHFYNTQFELHSFIVNNLEKLNYFLRTTEKSNLYMESIMFQYVFVRFLTTSNTNDPFTNNIPLHIAKLKRIFDTRYYESHTLNSLQDELQISKYTLCRDFSTYYGTSPLKYLNKVRIDRAKELLLETNQTIVSIGNEVGIDNTTHFINLFKRQTGDTPLKYRQSHLGTGLNGNILFPSTESL